MGDKSPIILTERKKRKIAAAAKKEMRARFEWAIDNNDLKTNKDTDKNPAIDWISLSTQEIAQMDTQCPSDDPGWWQMWKRNQELEKEMLELMKK